MTRLHSTTATLAACLLIASACAGESAQSDEPEYGLAGKADGLCDPAADLCWWTKDIVATRAIIDKQDELSLGRGDSRELLLGMVEDLKLINQKLTQAERDAVIAIEPRIAELPDAATNEEVAELYKELRAGAIDRLMGTYFATYAIQAGHAADNDFSGKSDESDANHGHEDTGLTEGMKESLDQLRRSGVLGKGYAAMLEMSGVLDKDYVIINAQNFGELGPDGKIVPRGLSREERVDIIVDNYALAGGFVGLVSGAEALIPVAGVALSIAHETYELFRLHAQMTFEIAAVYGWDIREGRNLYRVTTMLLTTGLLIESADVLVSNLAVPLVVRSLAKRFGVQLPADLAMKIANRSLNQLLGFFTKKSQQKLAEQALKHGAKGVAGQLLGWATVGLTVFVSGAIDYLATEHVGQHVAAVAKRHVEDLMMEGSTHLSKPAPRDCMFTAMGAVMMADGKLADRERRYYIAMLSKQYRSPGQRGAWFRLSKDEVRRQSLALKSIAQNPRDAASDAESCLEEHFEELQAHYKLNILGHIYGAMQIDLEEHSTERQFYDTARDTLDGDGFFDGTDITEYLAYLERSIDVVVQPGSIDVPDEFKEDVQSILPEDQLDFIAASDPDTNAEFACAFDNSCN